MNTFVKWTTLVLFVLTIATFAVGFTQKRSRNNTGPQTEQVRMMAKIRQICEQTAVQQDAKDDGAPGRQSRTQKLLAEFCAGGSTGGGPTDYVNYKCKVAGHVSTGNCTNSVWEHLFTGIPYCSSLAIMCYDLGGDWSTTE